MKHLLLLLFAALSLTAQSLSYRTYTVTNSNVFSALSLPMPANSLLFVNGVLALPSQSYSIANGTFQFTPAAAAQLSIGDQVTVVSMIPATTSSARRKGKDEARRGKP